MPTIQFSVVTDLPPSSVMSALVDFGDQRPNRYSNIDRSHFRVHDRGLNWADVTEGNMLAWERSRYDWDEARGLVTVKTLESDSWGPGSSWEYHLQPVTPIGTRIEVTVVRHPKTLRGRIIGLGLPMFGRGVLQRDLQAVLRKSR